MKGIKKGLAILLVLCTLLSMVVMTGAGTADTAQDAQPLAASGDSFMKMVLIDSGRGFVSVKNVKAIIDEMARCDYEYLMLGIGNDGLRFLLDDMSVTANDQTYYGENYGETIKNAIIAKNDELAPNAKGQWSEADMNAIIAYATSKDISIVPLLNTPGHATSIVAAMTACGIDAELGNRGNSTDTGSVTFDVMNSEAVAFMEAFVQKYITYFASKGCTYFNLGMDEFAGNHGGWSNMSDAEQTALGTYLSDLVGKLKTANMTPMAFCDVIGNMASVDNSVIGINWNGGYLSGHSNINANYNWYYVLGATGTGWAGYDKALAATASTSVTTPISGTAGAGSLLAIWNDNYLPFTDAELAKVKSLVNSQATNNPTYFTVQQEDTITVVLNGTKEVGVSSDNITEQPNSTYASVEIEPTEMTTGKYVQVDSIESGKRYILVNQGVYVTNTTTNSRNVSGLTCALFSASDTAGSYNDFLWTIKEVSGGYTVQNASGKYLNVASSSGNANVTLTKTARALTISDLGTTFTIANGNTYFDRFDNTFAAGWGGSGAGSSNPNEQWALYEYQEAPAYTMTVTGNAIGETYVTVGNVRYTIRVTAEDLSQAPSLTYHPWISNYAISPDGTGAAHCISSEGTAREVDIAATAEDVYREKGVEFSTLVPETGDWYYEGEGVQTYFWKGTVLAAGNHQNEGTNKSTDMSMRGTDFTYLRYWGGAWSYSSDRVNWTNVQDTDEVCAYYLQKTAVTTEVDTYVKDWAFTTNNSNKSSSRYQKALSFAVVYPNGQLSPSTESAIYSKSTLIYWDNLNPMTFIRIGTNGVYEIEKITYTFGERVNKSSGSVNWTSNDSIDWEKTGTGTAEEWYDETVCWDENYGTEPVVNGADLSEEIFAGNSTETKNGDPTNYDGNWGANDAVLILIYLKPVVTEDSLIVRYYDDTANAEITNFAIQVANESTAAPKTFRNSLTPPFVGENANTVYPEGLDNNAYVTNLNNINENIEQDLTKLSSLRGKYASGLYQYVGAEISEDGKTLTLHYNLDSSKLSKNYVVDFGLPVEIPFADLVKETNTIQSVTVATPVNGTATIDDAKEVIRYAPERAYAGVVTLSVTVTFNGNTTNDNTTQVFSVGITPATTVYYEEGFAVRYNASATGGSKGDAPQKTELAGKKTNVYGYDAAYASAVGDSNGTAMKLAAGAGAATFTFTGTGVDIYTRSTKETGSLMIRVVDGNGDLVKVLSVNTVMQNGSTGATTGQAGRAYHVPVVSLSGLAHGTYTLQIAAVKSGSAGAKEVYLDGFRVYGTLEDQANEVYKADLEDSPTFIELRDEVLTAQNVSTDGSQYANQIAENVISQVHAVSNSTTGAVIMSNNPKFNDADMQDLLDNGPKNEIYLQQGQALTFTINTKRVVQVGLKALNQATTYTINNGTEQSLNASTDMFYTVLNKAENETERTITITNKGEGILSITKLKVCDDPNATLGELTAEDLIPALVSLGYEGEPVEAEAVLNITVQAGDQTVTAQLTATGIEGESHTFTAAEIKAAAEAALPEGYTLDGVTFEDVTVVCGAQGETSYTAAAVQNPTPDQPTKVLQKLLAVIKNIFERLFRWL